LSEAQALAFYTETPYAGLPAIALNRFGKGQAIYVGTCGDEALYQALFGWLLPELGIAGSLSTPPGVEAAVRWQGDRRLLFLLNHTGVSQTVTLTEDFLNLSNGQGCGGSVVLAPYDVLALADATEDRRKRK